MTRCIAAINLLFLGLAAPAFAEPPTSVDVVATTAKSEILPLMVKTAHREISSRLRVVIFEDDLSGASAAVQLTPILPGCKVGLTYTF